MISTRLHGSIDYAVTALFGGLAASRRLPPAVRATFGATGAYHAGYALVTDYEAGVQPGISMRQHLALDALGAAGLIASALLMRRQPPGARAVLLGAGLLEAAVIARSSAWPRTGPGSVEGWTGRMLGALPSGLVGEPPLDTLKPIAEDVFVVDSILSRPLGVKLPVRMTVIRLPNGHLLLHSPTRFTPRLHATLRSLGPIRHLVAPNSTHWLFVRDWQRACPDATSWAAPGLRRRPQVRISGVRLDRVLSDTAPAEWPGVQVAIVPGGLGFREVALFHQPSGTLVLTDLVLELQPGQVPPLLRPLLSALDIVGSGGKPPVYVRAAIRLRRRAAARAIRRLLDLRPERVVFAHGAWFRRDATGALRHALRWLV